MVDYVRYVAKTKKFYATGKRPGNQNAVPVQKKIAARLQKLVLENPNLSLTDLQKQFVDSVRQDGKVQLQKNGIDIAHNIAISTLIEEIVNRMNDPSRNNHNDDSKFADDLLSTYDNVGRENARIFFQALQDPNLSPKIKIEKANQVITHWNRASRNLISGFASANRSIGNARDPHLVRDKENKFVETPTAVRISRSANDFLSSPYKPKERKSPDGKIEQQSSSVSKVANSSWSVIRVLPPVLPSESESETDDTENDADQTGLSITNYSTTYQEISSDSDNTEHDADQISCGFDTDTEQNSDSETSKSCESESLSASLSVQSETVKKEKEQQGRKIVHSVSLSFPKEKIVTSVTGFFKSLPFFPISTKKNISPQSLTEEKKEAQIEKKTTLSNK